MTQPFNGWGNDHWGQGPWGSPVQVGLQVVSALAIAENKVRVTLNMPAYWSGILDVADASNPARWLVAPAQGSPVGWDGNPPRNVIVVLVTQPSVSGTAYGSVLDLTLDRPMTPFPSLYTMTANGLYSADESQQLDTNFASAGFGGVYAKLEPRSVESGVHGRDLANPQSMFQAQGSTISNPAQAVLGSFNYAAGDYAMDSRDAGLLKRLNRRTFTKPDGFVFLPGYGIGVQLYAKRLGRASTRGELAAECEAQYSQEPEVASVSVLAVPDAATPNLVRLRVGVAKKDGKSIRYSTNLPIR